MVAFRSLLAISATLLAASTSVAANPSVVSALENALARSKNFQPRSETNVVSAVENALSLAKGLQTRQLSGISDSDVPDSCKNDCVKAEAIGDCTDLKCVCNADMDSAIQSCFSCAVAAGSGNQAQYQDLSNDYVTTCKNAGFNVNPITISKANAGKGNGAFSISPSFGLLGLSAAAIVLA